MQTMDKITKKSEDEIFWTFLSRFDQFRQKMPFSQNCDLFKTTFCVITCARIKLEAWNLVNECREKSQKFHKKLNFEFSIIFNFIEFLCCFFRKKFIKIAIKKIQRAPITISCYKNCCSYKTSSEYAENIKEIEWYDFGCTHLLLGHLTKLAIWAPCS